MAGRSPDVDAPRTASIWSRWRGACALAGLLCVLGVASGSTVAVGQAPHHRSPAITAAAGVADGQGTNIRGDLHLVATLTATTELSPRSATGRVADESSRDVTDVDSVRTRGPPQLAALSPAVP